LVAAKPQVGFGGVQAGIGQAFFLGGVEAGFQQAGSVHGGASQAGKAGEEEGPGGKASQSYKVASFQKESSYSGIGKVDS
jgi:hypothetical protein